MRGYRVATGGWWIAAQCGISALRSLTLVVPNLFLVKTENSFVFSFIKQYEMMQVVEILPRGNQALVYPI